MIRLFLGFAVWLLVGVAAFIEPFPQRIPHTQECVNENSR